MSSMFQPNTKGSPQRADPKAPVRQVAALCHRMGADGCEVLLITSSSGRWILPKGWTEDGMTDAEAAQQEAWEEAGVREGTIDQTPIGSYASEKLFDNRAVVPCQVDVFVIKVEKLGDDFPEAHKRQRRWVPAASAANTVNEPALVAILRQFADTQRKI